MDKYFKRRFPYYFDDSDYQTNAPSYYDDLARKQKLIEMLAKKIWEYEETLDLTLEQITNRLESYIEENDTLMMDRLEQWDLNLEKFPENVELLLQEWLSDGTLDHIINDTIFNWKADKTYVDDLNEIVNTKLSQMVTVNVKDFGAVGDGVTDDYEALQLAYQEITNAGGGTLLFPIGDYYIGQYRTNTNDVDNLTIENVDGLNIVGYGAKITSKGDFNRGNDNGSGTSYSNIVQPLLIRDSKNVQISGLELYGQVDLMTKETGVVEGSNHGINLSGVDTCTITDVYVHHFASDGVYIGTGGSNPNYKANRNVVLINVKSLNNARQSISIIQCVGLTSINCEFSETGNTGGSYGQHAPALGIDIEPNRSLGVIDEITTNILFTNCRIMDNTGGMIASVLGENAIGKVSFRDCTMDAGQGNEYRYQIMLGSQDTLIENCDIDLRGGEFYPLRNYDYTKTTLKNNIIKAQTRGVVVSRGERGTLKIDSNILTRVIGGGPENTFPYIAASDESNITFTNNTVFIPKENYSGTGRGQQASLIQRVKLSKNNRFLTDLEVIDSEHFAVSYDQTKVIEDFFPNKNFRSILNSSYTGELYSSMASHGGSSLILSTQSSGNNYGELRYDNSVPDSGDYRRGDIIFNTTPSIGGHVGWVCVTSGNPGTWNKFGLIDSE